MKIIIIALLLLVSVTALGQNNVGIVTTKPADSTIRFPKIQANDSTALFSARDLQPLLERLAKMPYESAAPLIGYLQQLLALRMKEWEELQNKPKNK